MMNNIEQRLDQLEEKIRNPAFRQSTGKANEVNYWVFDYASEQELEVRDWIVYMKNKNSRHNEDFNLAVFDLYDIVLDYLESKNFIAKCEEMEQKKGLERLASAIQHTLRMTDRDNVLVQYITTHLPDQAVVFLTGIGKCYPILQAPEVFNKVLYNMPIRYASVPMVLFYPGVYTEQELRIFNKVKEDNYYRAFRIVR